MTSKIISKKIITKKMNKKTSKNRYLFSLILIFTLHVGPGLLSAQAGDALTPPHEAPAASADPVIPEATPRDVKVQETDLGEIVLSNLNSNPNHSEGAFYPEGESPAKTFFSSIFRKKNSKVKVLSPAIDRDLEMGDLSNADAANLILMVPLDGSNNSNEMPQLPGAFPQESVEDSVTTRKHFDLSFAKSLFNMKEVVCPLTARKAAFWCGYAGIAGGMVALEHYTGASKYIIEAVKYNSTALMAVIYGTEPLMTAVNLLVAHYPLAVKQVDEESRIIPTPGAEEVALVIPCHESAAQIGKTIHAALKHLKPEQIFVVDNGKSELPTDNTKEVVAAIDAKINYIWVPLGNKNIAQYAGALAAKDYKYVLTTDDDVTIPASFDFGTQLMDDQVKAVCYPVRGVTEDGKPSLLVEWQDLEYQNADLAKLAEAFFGGVLYPHGAGSLWERKTLIQALRLHDTVFYAEDVKMGLALQKLRKTMKVCGSSFLNTSAPTTLFGAFPNYYQQRVRSWEMGRHVYFWKFVQNLVTPGPPRSALGHAFVKGVQFLAVVGNLADYARIPLMVIMRDDPSYWVKFGAFTVGSIAPAFWWNYVKLSHRPDLQTTLRAVVTVPAYKLLYSAVSVLSIPRALFIYLPNLEPKPTIEKLEQDQDRRCVWLKWDQQAKIDPPGPAREDTGVDLVELN